MSLRSWRWALGWLVACGAPEPVAWTAPRPWCDLPEPTQGRGEPALRVADGYVTCVMFDRLLDWDGLADAKARLWLAAGDVHLVDPDADTTTSVLPACVEDEPGTPGAAAVGAATATWADADDLRVLTVLQPLSSGDTLRVAARWAADDGPFVLDGVHVPIEQPVALTVELCAGACGAGAVRRFDSCTFEDQPTQRHTVTVDGGAIEVDLRIATSLFATQPGALVRVGGTLDGAAFEQIDYDALLYRPEHHHISRDLRAALVPPIGDAAWLEITGLDPLGTAPPTVARLLDAGGAPLRPLDVTDEAFAVLPP